MTLLSRLEAATAGSRELDAEIAEHVGIRHRSRRVGGKSKGREWFVDSHGGVEEWAPHPLAFSTSIDAAMSLVPDDFEIGLVWARDDRHAMASMGVNAISGFPRGEGEAKSLNRQHALALALCIAALKARSAA